MARLGDICQKGSSGIAQKDLINRIGEYPIYGASGFIKNIDFYHQDKPYIAVVKDGAGVGRVMKLPAKSSVIGTMQYIIPNKNINVSYLTYALEYLNLARFYTGATIPHIYFKDYCQEQLPDHSWIEQCSIATILDKISDLIALRKRQLDKLDELVKARFVEMFGDLLSNTMHWTFKPLAELCDVRDGTHDSPKYYSTGYPLLTSKNFTNGFVDFSNASLISKEDFDAINQRSKVGYGDIVMPMIGTIGHPVIIDTNQLFAIKNVALIKIIAIQ